MAASLKRLFGRHEAPSPEAANSGNAHTPTPDAAQAAKYTPITPPWQVRRAPMLIAAAVVLVLAGIGYLAYELWLFHTNPLAQATSITTAPTTAPAANAPTAPPIVEVPQPVVEPPPQKAKPRPPAPAAAATVGVTHTVREVPQPAPAAPSPAPATPPKSDPACPEAVSALGLCRAAPAAK